jgi:hypothetical protein
LIETSSDRGGLIDWQDAPRGWQNTPKKSFRD